MSNKMEILYSNADINSYLNLKLDLVKNIEFSSQKNNICIFKALNNINDINEIFNNKYKAFEALESLILNDNEKRNDNNKEIKRKKNKSKSSKDVMNRDRNKTVEKNLKTEIIYIPKLDFTKIYKKYTSKKLKIKEISIIYDEDEKNEKKMNKNLLNHGHHHHKHHHKKKNEILQK